MSAREVAQSVPVSSRDDLYFVQAESGHIKIGRATKVRKRMSNLQIGCFEKLTMRASLPGRGYEESVWHAAFQDDRLSGEWFQRSADLDEAIELAVAGKEWWNHLTPPDAFPLSDDDEEYDDDVVDWHIALLLSIAALRDGEKPPTRDAAALDAFGQARMVEYINRAAANSYDSECAQTLSGRGK